MPLKLLVSGRFQEFRCDSFIALSSQLNLYFCSLFFSQLDCCSSDEDSGISEQDILRFKANQKMLSAQRKELREKLQQKFDNMTLKEGDSQTASSSLADNLNGLNVGVVH